MSEIDTFVIAVLNDGISQKAWEVSLFNLTTTEMTNGREIP